MQSKIKTWNLPAKRLCEKTIPLTYPLLCWMHPPISISGGGHVESVGGTNDIKIEEMRINDRHILKDIVSWDWAEKEHFNCYVLRWNQIIRLNNANFFYLSNFNIKLVES